MSSYQYRKSHCGDKTILRLSYLHNGISYTGKTTYLYWIRAMVFTELHEMGHVSQVAITNIIIMTPYFISVLCLSVHPSIHPSVHQVVNVIRIFYLFFCGLQMFCIYNYLSFSDYFSSQIVHSLLSPVYCHIPWTHWSWDKMATIFQTFSS